MLRVLYRLGVRIMTLTWNFENELGWPNAAAGAAENSTTSVAAMVTAEIEVCPVIRQCPSTAWAVMVYCIPDSSPLMRTGSPDQRECILSPRALVQLRFSSMPFPPSSASTSSQSVPRSRTVMLFTSVAGPPARRYQPATPITASRKTAITIMTGMAMMFRFFFCRGDARLDAFAFLDFSSGAGGGPSSSSARRVWGAAKTGSFPPPGSGDGSSSSSLSTGASGTSVVGEKLSTNFSSMDSTSAKRTGSTGSSMDSSGTSISSPAMSGGTIRVSLTLLRFI